MVCVPAPHLTDITNDDDVKMGTNDVIICCRALKFVKFLRSVFYSGLMFCQSSTNQGHYSEACD